MKTLYSDKKTNKLADKPRDQFMDLRFGYSEGNLWRIKFKAVDALIKGAFDAKCADDPTQAEIDDVYIKAADGEFMKVKGAIEAEWNHAHTAFEMLLKKRNFDPLKIDAHLQSAAKTVEHILIACAFAKDKFDTARPWQFASSGALTGDGILQRWNGGGELGSIAPHHPSFPAGHSCDAFARATLLKRNFTDVDGLHAAADQAAKDIGTNRIIAGIHFQRDIDAAEQLVKAALG